MTIEDKIEFLNRKYRKTNGYMLKKSYQIYILAASSQINTKDRTMRNLQ